MEKSQIRWKDETYLHCWVSLGELQGNTRKTLARRKLKRMTSLMWLVVGIVSESSSSSQGFSLKGWAVSARETEAASQFFLGLPVYFKLMILFYTFTKALGQRFDIFSSHWPRIIFFQKSLLPLKRSSFLSDSLIYFFSCVLVNTLQLMLILGFIPHSSV